MKNQFLIGFTLMLAIFMIRPGAAQTIEMSMVADSNSTIEIDHTRLLVSDAGQNFISGNNNIQIKHVLNNKFNLIGEVSYLYEKTDFFTQNGFSNVFLGAQYKTSKKESVNSALNFGIYLPTANREVQAASLYNLFDVPKFINDGLGFHVGYNSFFHYANGFRLGFELGSDLIIPVGDSSDEDPEVLGRYGLSLMYKTTSGIYFQSELLGVANITNEDEGFNDSTFHTYALGAGYNGSKMGAGLYYRNYFDELFEDSFNGIFGIELNIFL